MALHQHDLVVIGAGPGGYVAAIRAAQLGLNVACVEQEAALGGTCLRVGCIPSKALLESSQHYHEVSHDLGVHGIELDGVTLDLAAMLGRKDRIVSQITGGVAFLFKKHRITRYAGTARLTGPHSVVVEGGETSTVTAKHILIATGSRPATLPGIELDLARIVTSTEALAFPEVPKRLVVIGAGAIGVELGSVWRRLGSEVVVLEYLDRILPTMDAEAARLAQRSLKRQGLDFRLGARVIGARVRGEAALVEVEGSEPLEADRVLVAVGRAPQTEGLGLAEAGVECDARGFIRVDERYQTSIEGVYAVGDVIGGAMLAHKASEEGIAFVERLVTGYGHVNYDAIPSVVYTEPEVASVGKTQEQLQADGVPFNKGQFFFKANGRAVALGHADGAVKILAHADTDRVLGVHIVGPRASELIAEAVMALECGASSEDIARISHAHPTLAEAIKEAALAVAGRALHA
jgi:dihydrolipoamide dehydrogenase